MSLKTKHKNIT